MQPQRTNHWAVARSGVGIWGWDLLTKAWVVVRMAVQVRTKMVIRPGVDLVLRV